MNWHHIDISKRFHLWFDTRVKIGHPVDVLRCVLWISEHLTVFITSDVSQDWFKTWEASGCVGHRVLVFTGINRNLCGLRRSQNLTLAGLTFEHNFLAVFITSNPIILKTQSKNRQSKWNGSADISLPKQACQLKSDPWNPCKKLRAVAQI